MERRRSRYTATVLPDLSAVGLKLREMRSRLCEIVDENPGIQKDEHKAAVISEAYDLLTVVSDRVDKLSASIRKEQEARSSATGSLL
jgi:hypothetical protein